jgi:histidine triad (HIT) family protein
MTAGGSGRCSSAAIAAGSAVPAQGRSPNYGSDMGACVFCDIVSGHARSYLIDGDAHSVAFLDANPMTPGHTLVLPRSHIQDLWSADEKTASALMTMAYRVARLLHATLEPDGLNLLHATGAAAFQSVFHLHLHVVPRWTTDGLPPPPWPQPPGDPRRLAAIASRLRAARDRRSRDDALDRPLTD